MCARPHGLERHTARLVVGADGGNSIVARAAGVARPARLAPRVGLTFHLEDRPGDPGADARMRVFRDGYVGVAPVPGGRVNVGIVLGRSWGPRLAADGAEAVADGGRRPAFRFSMVPPARRRIPRHGGREHASTASPAPARSATA